MVVKRPKMTIDTKAQAQIDATREACLRTMKRGKSQVGDSAKHPAKSPIKLVATTNTPSSSNPIEHQL